MYSVSPKCDIFFKDITTPPPHTSQVILFSPVYYFYQKARCKMQYHYRNDEAPPLTPPVRGHDCLPTKAFSETESEIRSIVIVASLVVALLMTVTVCLTAGVVRSASTTLTRPVNQLVDIVKGLNNLDFSEQVRGPPSVKEVRLALFPRTTEGVYSATTINSGNKFVALLLHEGNEIRPRLAYRTAFHFS